MEVTHSSIAQAAVAGGLALVYIGSRVLPTRPLWLQIFAKEHIEKRAIVKRPWTFNTFALILISISGLGATIASAIAPPPNAWRWLGITPWVVSLILTLIQRPRKTPKTLLGLFLTSLVGTLVASISTQARADRTSILHLGEICITLGGIAIVLSMPMRDPVLGNEGIAGKYDAASVELRSPEDDVSLWQWMSVSWLKPLLRKGYKQQLDDSDVWLLPYEFQHARLHELFRSLPGSLIKRLMLANGLDLMIITFLALVESGSNLGTPMLLQRLLASIQSATSPREESIAFAVAILVVRLAASQSGVFSLWYCRRAYERSRGEMITSIYAKTLTRKSQGFTPDEKDAAHVNGNDLNGEDPEEEGWFTRLLARLSWRKKPAKYAPIKATPPPATMGKILNLMRNDCYEIAQRFWEFGNLFTKPLQFLVSLGLLWFLLGWSCLVGIAWVVLAQIFNALFVRRLIVNEKLRRAATDKRLQATSQFVEAIRHLRWYDWQSEWLKRIMEERNDELFLKIITGLWTVGISTINISAGMLFPVASFFAYTYIAKHSLTVDIAFPALQLFSMLETSLRELPDLITVLLNATVAIERLETFMREPDKEEGESSLMPEDIEFRDASLSWPGMHATVLTDLNLRFSKGFSVVYGLVGAGKTALLQGILGELDQKAGDAVLPTEMIGYCAQAPWLQNMSIRENILFCAPYEPERYRKVLEACALTQDLAGFKHGDLTDIGEGGVGLSGGQKARVALARAVYSQSRILLLDDPLAPLDHNTAESSSGGPLFEGRTVVLVTHRIDLCIHLADQAVEVHDGKARVLQPDEVPQNVIESEHNLAEHEEDQHSADAVAEVDAAIPDKFIADEHRKDGGVVLSVYWTYIKAGKLYLWAVLISLFALLRFSRLFSDWFLKAWTEGYKKGQAHANTQRDDSFGSGLFKNLPNPQDDVSPWLFGYLAIGLLNTLVFTLASCALLLILYIAAKSLFIRVLNKVSNATFRFYDVTPVGRLMNRLTSDIGMLDGGVIGPLQNFAFNGLTFITCLAVIAAATPLFFFFALIMTAGFIFFFMEFLPTSQSLRRLEMVSLSPLMSNFGILLEGLATIRAFRSQTHFQNRNIVIVDAFQKMDHFYWSLQAWLQYRFDTLSAFATFALTLIALYRGLSPGLTAFVLLTAARFVEATHALCKQYGQLQMDFVSVERVVELLDLEEESSGDLVPSAAWPGYGDAIAFEGVTMRYAAHLAPSLSEVSFTIPGGATCAVLGRTGSGKSTLALALLATLKPSEGRIRVGGLDLANVDVHTWRQRISFVAQDPVLFPGTLRQNLDPLHEHDDDECIAVLRRVLGADWSLRSHVEAGGKNLSQGQRQLVGIGRAVLRRSPVVVLDEATASIDKTTAMAIQEVLRDELRQSTVITIAHRLEAVKDVDYFVRLENGRVVEFGPAGKKLA
ncbi:ATP-dependent bile acid permease [Apiospora saccharicola]|uniref:ATP-dependent bile acid permease n=1 Tax=Apiospora saccharicola TaxID=335842 RepID=A0ABR1WEV8_9PEZI